VALGPCVFRRFSRLCLSTPASTRSRRPRAGTRVNPRAKADLNSSFSTSRFRTATGSRSAGNCGTSTARSFPVIFLSGERTQPFDRAAGLLLGGDDYVIKPFDPDELLARIRRCLDELAATTARSQRAKAVSQSRSASSRCYGCSPKGTTRKRSPRGSDQSEDGREPPPAGDGKARRSQSRPCWLPAPTGWESSARGATLHRAATLSSTARACCVARGR
jgi:hypothetical protein